MRQPLWILNSVIFLLVVVALFFLFFSRVTIEERESLEPAFVKPPTQKDYQINLSQIYKYDIFRTYREEGPKLVTPKYVRPLPKPPSSSKAEIPKTPEVKFLDPLKITLKGVMSISNGIGSSAIIQNNETKREANYKVGDVIGDAQLIRIFNNKVIFVRSNGQQEVFYLSAEDAKSDPAFLNIENWKGIVRKYAENSYMVSPLEFLKRVKNLAQFIDLLGLTSAYKKGESIGCRIGDLKQDSLGMRLGFKKGDILLTVNDIKATTIANRLKIYKIVTSTKEGSLINVKLQRGAKHIFKLNYKLQEFITPSQHVASKVVGKPVVSPADIRDEQQKLLEQKYKMNSSVKKIRNLEVKNMLQKGARPQKKFKK